MLLCQVVQMVLGPIQQENGFLSELGILGLQDLGQVGEVEPHHLHVRVGLQEGVVGPSIVVDSRDQRDSGLDGYNWRRVRCATKPPLPSSEV